MSNEESVVDVLVAAVVLVGLVATRRAFPSRRHFWVVAGTIGVLLILLFGLAALVASLPDGPCCGPPSLDQPGR